MCIRDSLLGALAWLTLTRADIIVFVGRYQRKANDIRVSDVYGLNRLLKWVKRRQFCIYYAKLTPPLALVVVADSAYKADDDDCQS